MSAKIIQFPKTDRKPVEHSSLLDRPQSFQAGPFGVNTKYHPYSSKEEFEYRMECFVREQRNLFEPFPEIYKALIANGDDLTKTVVFGRYGYLDGITQLLKSYIADIIFGDLNNKAEFNHYICKVSEEEENRWLLKEKLFHPEQLFHDVGEIVSAKNLTVRESTLYLSALTEKEQILCAERAFQLHSALSFSSIFYKRLQKPNPMQEFVREIAEIGTKLYPGSIIEGVYDCRADKFLANPRQKRGGYLQVYERTDKKPIILENCIEKVHSHMIKCGDSVKCVVTQEEPNRYLGSLVWIPYKSQARMKN
jgi:hypothetical protein